MRLAQQVLGVLDAGSKTQTYKFALLVALIDEVLEHVDVDGRAPTSTTGTALADRVVRLYWAQTRPIDAHGHARQSGQSSGLVDVAAERRALLAGAGWLPYDSFRGVDPEGEEALRRRARRAICGYAIPLLQRYGSGSTAVTVPFLYESWAEQRTAHDDHRGDRLDLLPGVGDALVSVGPLLRRLVEAEWLTFVHARNRGRVAEPLLERALFGAARTTLQPARAALLDLQGPACTYCGATTSLEADHFLPWSLSRDDALNNLVLACRACNGDKRAQLAGAAPLEEWVARNSKLRPQLAAAARAIGWPDDLAATRSRGRALYRAQAAAVIPFWTGRARPPAGMSVSEALSLLAA
jgi:5-methylcytosine-specific restriction endonuclease McrA